MLCSHDDDPATCPPCRREAGKDPGLAVAATEYGEPFQAMYDGWCPGCSRTIDRGDTIRSYTAGAREGFVHDDCEVP